MNFLTPLLVALGLAILGSAFGAEEPFTLLEGKYTDMAQDAEGDIWAINKETNNTVYVLEDGKWVAQEMRPTGVTMRPMHLTALPDGWVAALWNDTTNPDVHYITRHRGLESLPAGELSADSEMPKEPRMFGLPDNVMVITGRGDHVMHLTQMKNAKGAFLELRKIRLREDLWLEPEVPNSDGSISQERTAVSVVADNSGGFWAWNYEMRKSTSQWRLEGLVHLSVKESGNKLELFRPGDSAPAISAMVPWEGQTLAMGIIGKGLYVLDLEKRTLSPMPAPEPSAFHYVEQMFHDGTSWHVITTPRPSDYEMSVSSTLTGMITTITTHYHDASKPAGTLWRLEGTKWTKMHDGIDESPPFGRQRPWLKTKFGLFLGSHFSSPWFFPKDPGSPPIRLDAMFGLPLAAPIRMYRVDAEHVVMLDQAGRTCLSPADIPKLATSRPKSKRIEILASLGQALQDDRGDIWYIRNDRKFMRWNGREWLEQASPEGGIKVPTLGFVADDRNQGWLLPQGNQKTVICDFSTGKWRVFKTLQEALQAQLPKGVSLNLPNLPTFEPSFSTDGRIGAYFGNDKVVLFENGAWKSWRFQDVAGAEARLRVAPYFDADGQFSLAIDESEAWKWQPASGWTLQTGVSTPPYRSSFENETDEIRTLRDADLNPSTITTAVRDRTGTIWMMRGKGELLKYAAGKVVPALMSGEPNPFLHGGSIRRAIADASGNVLLEMSGTRDTNKQVFIRANSPLATCTLHLHETKQDSADIRIDKQSPERPWISWRLGDGPWSKAARINEIKLAGLAPGKYTVQARTYNEELTLSPELGNLAFEIQPSPSTGSYVLINRLSSSDPGERDAASKLLKRQGAASIPALKTARQTATPAVREMIDSIIKVIEEDER